MRKANNYTYSVVWSEEDGEYVGLCAEFPHLSFLDPDPAAALDGVRDSVAIALELFAEDGARPPRPPSRAARSAVAYA